ncbi:MAG: hypothetical protein M3P27_04275 [Acidobacteriota bacterium]|nr:hypothetical protein [Acidobacteriota bacterium]
MTSDTLSLVVWWAGMALQAGIVCALAYRRLYRDLPIFFTYTVFLIVRSLVLYFVLRPFPLGYFYGYWGAEIVAWALGLAVIQEVLEHLLRPYHAVQHLALMLFRWGAALLVLMALLMAYAGPGLEVDRLLTNILMLERGVRIVQVGLLSLLFVLARAMRLRWPHYVFGIALGLAIFTSVDLALVTVRTHAIWTHAVFTIMKPLAFVVAQGVWLYYLAVPERAADYQPQPAPQMEGWNGALAELLRR